MTRHLLRARATLTDKGLTFNPILPAPSNRTAVRLFRARKRIAELVVKTRREMIQKALFFTGDSQEEERMYATETLQ
jgi:hypothetical protein